MKTLNLFLKMHFTSLSPDGQPVSLAIVTEEYFNEEYQKYYTDKVEIKKGNCSIDHLITKSFYAEFSDFYINQCDDFVKENVISKLEFYPESHDKTDEYDMQHWDMCKNITGVKIKLTKWLTQFSDYKLNFIVDCGWFCWGKFVELMGEWEEIGAKGILMVPEQNFSEDELKKIIEDWKNNESVVYYKSSPTTFKPIKTGLPRLPANFPPVPIDLNDLIMERKGFKSVADAFNVDREELAFGYIENEKRVYYNNFKTAEMNFFGFPGEANKLDKFNALFDAKVTKAIYEKLK